MLGKLALITGGSGTIGCAIAAKFVREGASVVLVARNLERLEQAKQHIEYIEHMRSEYGRDRGSSAPYTGGRDDILQSAPSSSPTNERILCIPCDVSNELSVVKLFETIDQRYHRSIDVLVNNAGTNIPGETTSLSLADFEKVMQVNVTGPFLCAREAMKRMQKPNDNISSDDLEKRSTGSFKGGRIINIGSISAYSPRPDSCPYTTSKFALLGMTKSLALDGRRFGISVGIIHPGNVESTLLTEEMKRHRREFEGFLSPDDVADCVLTMASMPATANLLEMTVLPSQQPFVGRG